MDSYFGARFWPSLEKISDAVRETPEQRRRDRDRVMVRFDLSSSQYRLEAQSIYWGGSNVFFLADPGRDVYDIADLHLICGITKNGIEYQFRNTIWPTAWYYPIEAAYSGFSGKGNWPGIWLGLVKKGARPLSATVRKDIDNAVRYDCVEDELDGLACLKVTRYWRGADPLDVGRVQYWFVPEYDCALVRRERIAYRLDHRNDGHRFVTEWRDFQKVPGMRSLFPRRYINYDFVYRSGFANGLDFVHDVHITALSTESWPEDELPHTLFPPGTRISEPRGHYWGNREVSPEYKAKIMETMQIHAKAHHWAKQPWSKVVPAFPEDWLKRIDPEIVADILAGAGVRQKP